MNWGKTLWAMMSGKRARSFRVQNEQFLRFARRTISLLCLVAGGLLLVGGRRIGSGVFTMLMGLWLILENPLEHFEVLEGACPSCDSRIETRRRSEVICPACAEMIVVGSDRFHGVTKDMATDPTVSSLEEGGDEAVAMEPVVVSPGDTLDLHTFSPDEVSSLIDEFLRLAQEDDIRLANIIHGKGTGRLRRRVRGLLAKDPRVAAFYDAPQRSGGWGATIVELKPGPHEEGSQRGGDQDP